MTHTIEKVIQIIAAVGALTGSAYCLVCLWSAWAFVNDRRRRLAAKSNEQPGSWPHVSILKPLKGVDPEIYENFRSHCEQDYPEYEVIFGVSDAEDPAVPTVLRLQKEFPQRSIQLAVCSETLGVNIKVSNLVQMLRTARHDVLIVDDSDIRVPQDYLRRVIAPLSDPQVGMVTCLYRGVASSAFGSRLEALGISTDFSPGVLVARAIEGGVRFGLGSTMVFRRPDLETMGGFETLVDHLADDYELGKRIADLGKRILLSEVVVETFLPAYDFRGFLRHQLRWARGVRDSRRWGYVGLVFTFGLSWALLAALMARAPWGWCLLGLALLVRLAAATAVGWGVLRDRQTLVWLFLVPLRDLIGVLVWTTSFGGNTIDWRGDSFVLRDGRLVRVNTPRGKENN
jgi:ceramide glucosyltransferase